MQQNAHVHRLPSRATRGRMAGFCRAFTLVAALGFAGLILRGPSVAIAGEAVAAQTTAPNDKHANSAEDVRRGENKKGVHGIAMHGQPALEPGFPHFPYARPDAPKGGRLAIGIQGTFDSVNPFILKGVAINNVRGYVFESLLARSADEPFSLYGLIAERIEVPDDRREATFYLRPAARFSDGSPITAADVVYSQQFLRENGRHFYRSHYGKIESATAINKHTVHFRFSPDSDRELPLIIGLMPILPKHLADKESFGETTLKPLTGSGPYRIGKVEAGRSVTFERDANYWGRDLNVRIGLHNFDEIRFEFFRDSTAMFEAFKTGQINFRYETDPSRWSDGYNFPAVTGGRVVKRAQDLELPDGMRGLVFNTRRPVFANIRVRDALIGLFDFKWINQTLFSGLVARSRSYFARSALASTDRPISDLEIQLLGDHISAVDADARTGLWELPETDGSGRDRTLLRNAVSALREAGYTIRDGRMVHAETGKPLTFEFLTFRKTEERLMLAFSSILKRVGIEVQIRQVDKAQYWERLRTFDYDMIQWRWPASLSPGNEQFNRWSSRFADREGSLNFAGAKNPALDAMIDAMLAARDRETFEAAVRAYDRVLISGKYVIPLYHAPKQWVAHWTYLKQPESRVLFGLEINAWWAEPPQ